MNKKFTFVTLEERPDLENEINKLHNIGWINFMREDPIAIKYWDELLSYFPEYQFILLNEELKPMACGNAIAFCWDGNENSLAAGWDKVFEKGIVDFRNKVQPNSLSALAIVIHPEFRGKGLSKRMVRKMKELAVKSNFKNMVAPVRPSLKGMYPLIPMEEYMTWEREDGTPFDPWIRTHIKMGAQVIKVAEKSMVIPASIKEWEEWTGMKLPSSGRYIINEGLVPLEVDITTDKGVYVEPNVWLRHQIT